MKTLCHACLLLFSWSFSCAQYAPMSPQVSSAEGMFKTDIYSGAPNVDIPIYTFTSRDISVPISLHYTGGNGLRVNEEASWVGLGWYLQAGGVIAQQVRGFDDFNTDIGYIYTTNKALPCIEGQKNLPLNSSDQIDCYGAQTQLSDADWGTYDLEPDIYVLSLPGIYTKFFYDKRKKIFTASSSSISIFYVGNGLFQVSDDKFEYSFQNTEAVYDQSAQDSRFTRQGITWHLSTIESKSTGEKVTFFYSPSGTESLIQPVYSKTLFGIAPNYSTTELTSLRLNRPTTGTPRNDSLFKSTCFNCSSLTLCPDSLCSDYIKQYNKTEVKNISTNVLYLDSISGSFGKAYFTKSARPDMGANSLKLDEISVAAFDEKRTKKFLWRYSFLYSTFDSDTTHSLNPSNSYYAYPYMDRIGKRLKLLSVQQKSTDYSLSLPAYLFTYNENTTLPYKTSFDIDIWGHYNYLSPAKHNTDLVSLGMMGINRDFASSSTTVPATAWLLTKIRNPSGGFTEFEYEASGVGARILRVNMYDDPTKKLTKKYTYLSNPSYFMNPTPMYQIPLDVAYLGESCIFYDSNGGSNSPYYTRCKFNAYSSSSPIAFSDASAISSTNYTKVTELNGENGELGKTEYFFPSITYNAPGYPFLPVNKNPLEGTIKRMIVYKNVAGTFKKVSEQAYQYDFEKVSARTDGDPVTAESFSDTGKVTYTTTTSNGIRLGLGYFNYPLRFVNGYIMKMAQISSISTASTVYDQNDDTKGVTTFNILNFDKFGLIKESISNNDPKAGVGTYTRTYWGYERNGYAQYSPFEIVSYDFVGNVLSGTQVAKSYSATFNVYDTVNRISNYTSPLIRNVYTANANVVLSTKQIPKDTNYHKDIINTYQLGRLVQQDALWKKNISGGYSANFISTSTLWGYNSLFPIAVAKNADLTQVMYNGFETGALPGSVENGWDNGSVGSVSIVDKTVAGTDPTNVFTGRFSVKLNPSPGAGYSIYSPSFNLTPKSQSGRYKLSCWIKAPGAIGQNQASVYLYTILSTSPYTSTPGTGNSAQAYIDPSQHDWQYVEAILDFDKQKQAVGASTTLSIRCFVANNDLNVPIYVDDIRVQPVDAQMTTFTYSPGIGKTSEAGPDSKPVLYEYDALGRLLYTRDFRRNILKKNQYFTY